MVTPEDKRILFAEPQASSENVPSPTLPIEFGDAIPFVKHVIKLGALYIHFKEEMLNDSA